MSGDHDVGDLIRVDALFKDAAGAPANPGTVTLRLQSPSREVTTPIPSNPTVGTWRHEWVPDEGGNWVAEFKGTGAVQQTIVERVYVRPSLIRE